MLSRGRRVQGIAGDPKGIDCGRICKGRLDFTIILQWSLQWSLHFRC